MKTRSSLLSLLSVLGAVCAQAGVISTFDGNVRMVVQAPDKTGASYALPYAPGDNSRQPGRFSWTAKGRNFLEFYYGSDVPTRSQEIPQGRIVLRVRTDTPEAVWALGVRLKTPGGEIFHFESPTTLIGGTWEEVSIDVRQGKSKANWGGAKTGQLEGPLLLTGLSILANSESPAGEILIEHIAWESDSAPAKTK